MCFDHSKVRLEINSQIDRSGFFAMSILLPGDFFLAVRMVIVCFFLFKTNLFKTFHDELHMCFSVDSVSNGTGLKSDDFTLISRYDIMYYTSGPV